MKELDPSQFTVVTAIVTFLSILVLLPACSCSQTPTFRSGVVRTPSPAVLAAIGEPMLGSVEPSEEVYRLMFGDHMGDRWVIYRLRVDDTRPTLLVRVVHRGTECLSRVVFLDATHVRSLRGILNSTGFWKGALVPQASGTGIAWNHVSLEGMREGSSLYFEGIPALELAAFKPMKTECFRIAGTGNDIDSLWTLPCDDSRQSNFRLNPPTFASRGLRGKPRAARPAG